MITVLAYVIAAAALVYAGIVLYWWLGGKRGKQDRQQWPW